MQKNNGKYFKEEFLKSDEFIKNKDFLNFVLQENQLYSKEEVEKIIKKYFEEVI